MHLHSTADTPSASQEPVTARHVRGEDAPCLAATNRQKQIEQRPAQRPDPAARARRPAGQFRFNEGAALPLPLKYKLMDVTLEKSTQSLISSGNFRVQRVNGETLV